MINVSSSKWLVMIMGVCMLIYSCGDRADKTTVLVSEKTDTSASVNKRDTLNNVKQEAVKDTLVEALDEQYVRLNGKLKRYFSLQQFHSILGAPDSTKLLSDEESCTTIFTEADGSIDSQAKYLYRNGSRYESTKGKVAIDEVSFNNGDFIVYKNVVLNSSTTLKDLQKYFPVAAKHVTTTNLAGEGKIQEMQLREDEDNISDGHINLYLKNGRLYLLEWWFPC